VQAEDIRPAIATPYCSPTFAYSEGLSDAEEEVEMVSLSNIRGLAVIVEDHRIDGRVQVVAEIEADWPNGRPVPRTKAECVRKIIKAAGSNGDACDYTTCISIRLMKPQETWKHVFGILKYVAHIMEHDEADAVTHVRQCRRRQT
jgi:hypothetical protein